MDDRFKFDDNNGNTTQQDWCTGKSSASLTDRDHSDSHSLQGLMRQNMVVIPQKRIHTDRQIIPATLMEKLSYYRAFSSSSSKIEMLCMQQNNVNRFTWFYISNALCKSLSMTYVYIFLSAYTPDQHFFVPKMMPIFYGLTWINVICARFLLQTMSNNISLHFHYAITGLLFRAPWDRCVSRYMNYYHNLTYICLELEEFKEQFVNKTILYEELFYVTPTYEYFSVAQIIYFDHIFKQLTCEELGHNCILFIISILVWLLTAALHNQLFNRYIWKILHFTQMALCSLLFLIFCHLVWSYEDTEIQHIDAGEHDLHRSILMTGDFDMLAETMTAPPVAHIISSRTTSEIKPSLNSAVIVLSNGVYYIFKALTSYLMKKHCQRWVNATIIYWNYGSGSTFYYWPIYFATIKYGAVFAVIFFALNAVVEYCMFLISFQCLIEAVKYEWRWIKPWCVTAVILVLAIVELAVVDDDFSENSFVFYMALSSLAEILIIFWAYPLSRFLDDITFHFGVTPTRLRRWSFRLLPIFYSYKVYMMLHKFYIFSDTYNIFNILHTSRNAPTCISTLFLVGALYAFYYHVIKEKKGFSQLFKPVPEWGPKDYRLRQLRKQFINKEYIVSQAPRDLSRYLIEKSNLGCYKLDVPYEGRRRSTVCTDEKEVKEKYR